jgi:hypothetical protein
MSTPSPSRREFLKTAAAASVVGAVGVSPFASGSVPSPSPAPLAKSCIFINLVGGPSHLDTFDPKPTAKSDDRGPFRPIRTNVPGMMLSELFPKMAGMADKFSLLRGMHHTAPPVHEAGFQLLNTGRLFRDGPEWPSVGAALAYLNGHQLGDYPAWWVMMDTQIHSGIGISHGQSSGFLDVENFSPAQPWNHGRQEGEELPDLDVISICARSAIESGPRFGTPSVFVTINMFDTVFDKPSWDCHAAGGSLITTLDDYRDTVAPMFDTAFTALLTDLETRGLLDSTLVVATGEFGRTPWMNCNGGRDHWANAWTAIVAGGGTQGGRVIGATDRGGAEVADRPTTPQELVSTIFHAMGVPTNATIPGPDGTPVEVYPGTPIAELF